MRPPRSSFILLLSCAVLSSSAGVGADEAGSYRVAFIRPGAGGYTHGGNFLARVGKSVLVGSPSEFSTADAYDARTGALEHHFTSHFSFDDSAGFGGGVAAARRSFLVADPFQNEVYLFDRGDGRLRRTLRPPPDAESRGFGTGIAEVAKTIVVGDPGGGAPIGPPFYMSGPGAVFVFETRTGALVRTITSPAPKPEGKFGRTVVGCAGGFAVSQPGDYYEPGAVHVYDQDGNLYQTLQSPTPTARDGFGWALAAAGARLLVGRPGPTEAPGAAFLYRRRLGRYVLVRTFVPGAGGTLAFGRAVDLLGRRALVGGSNAATLFDAHSGSPLAILTPPVFDDPDMSGDYVPYLPWSGLGDSVALVGKTVVVGSEGSDENAGSIVVGFAPNADPPPECGAPYPCPNDPASLP